MQFQKRYFLNRCSPFRTLFCKYTEIIDFVTMNSIGGFVESEDFCIFCLLFIQSTLKYTDE